MSVTPQDLTQALIEASSKIGHVGWLIQREAPSFEVMHTLSDLVDDIEMDLVRLRRELRRNGAKAAQAMLAEQFDAIGQQMVNELQVLLKED